MTEENFEQCIAAVAAGDRAALKELYEEYLNYLYMIIYGVVGNRETAEDVTSECFIRIWETADRYKPGNGHKRYLATIARNLAIDEIRKHKREELTDEIPEDPTPPETGDHASPEEQTIEDISVQDALSRLNDKEREIINMKVLSDMTFKEISEILKIPMGTVTWRYREAVKKLRRCGYGGLE
ncbi:MAG: sigma-70 family RNA polymerase sigma factor [Lachnospiraceae bacterium]|nr:sigma-70 family RNA polymerase sigma factor [Lachnospiraceae bacterium]